MPSPFIDRSLRGAVRLTVVFTDVFVGADTFNCAEGSSSWLPDWRRPTCSLRSTCDRICVVQFVFVVSSLWPLSLPRGCASRRDGGASYVTAPVAPSQTVADLRPASRRRCTILGTTAVVVTRAWLSTSDFGGAGSMRRPTVPEGEFLTSSLICFRLFKHLS